ncbi:MAG: YkgJ family cysteine cluster protein [Lachnospiraceae bacterium]|nr:YkgJ family cysteine cluster protein [Lachnospiraceae bacterium]
MERHVNMAEISDGKRYKSTDMARLGCNECEGCSDCCREVGNSIVLDPWDIYMLEKNLRCGFEELLEKYLELNVVDGVVLPNLRLLGNRKGCTFLSELGRCKIHNFRPGFCRLFPLGRLYENGSFSYFLQTNECKKERRTKIKINKWLGIPNLAAYETFICEWHYLLKEVQMKAKVMEEQELRKKSMYFLQEFFVKPYLEEDFYGQFALRYQAACQFILA